MDNPEEPRATTETGTAEAAKETSAETTAGTAPRKCRRGAGRRRTGFAMPPVAWPVKGLWEAASEEERAEAHRVGALLLEHWLGRLTRAELGQKIGQPPVRVWQLSQQALSGLVVGLLKQPPKPPAGTPLPPKRPEEDPKTLRLRAETAERRLGVLEDLVKILREMPANREGPPGGGKAAGQPKRRGRPIGGKNRGVATAPRGLAAGQPEKPPTS